MLRVTSNFSNISAYFNLGVNFSGPVVNRHVIELFLLDRAGHIIERFERSQINFMSIADRSKIKF